MIILLLKYMPVCCSPRLDADCEDIVFDKIAEWSKMVEETSCYGNSELLLHKKMWDVLNRDKQGLRKEHCFVDWCRRIARIGAEGAATEHANNDNRFQKLAKDIFAHDLTAEQKKNPIYCIRESKSITTKQRSTVNVILRKNLGDARVASYILDRGVPALLDPPPNIKPVQSALLQNMLQEFMTWHGSLLRWLADKEKDPNTIMARKLSDLNLKEWQIERRRRKWEAQQELQQGTHLAKLRDGNNKHRHDMSATEQRVLEDFDSGKLEKQFDDRRVLKPNHWRSKTRYRATATEHG